MTRDEGMQPRTAHARCTFDCVNEPTEGVDLRVGEDPEVVRVVGAAATQVVLPFVMHDGLERGCERSAADAACDHHDVIVLGDVLRRRTVRAVKLENLPTIRTEHLLTTTPAKHVSLEGKTLEWNNCYFSGFVTARSLPFKRI